MYKLVDIRLVFESCLFFYFRVNDQSLSIELWVSSGYLSLWYFQPMTTYCDFMSNTLMRVVMTKSYWVFAQWVYYLS